MSITLSKDYHASCEQNKESRMKIIYHKGIKKKGDISVLAGVTRDLKRRKVQTHKWDLET